VGDDMQLSLSANTQIRRVEVIGLHGSADINVSLNPGLNVIYGRNGTGKTTLLHILANLLDGDLERFTHLRFERLRVVNDAGTVISLDRYDVSDVGAVRLAIDGQSTTLVQRNEATPITTRKALRQHLGGRPVYLPAFRVILEAISRQRVERYTADHRADEMRRLRDVEMEEPNLSAPDEQPLFSRRTRYLHERAESIAYKTILCREWFGRFVPTVRFPSLSEVAEELNNEYQAAQWSLAHRDRAAFSDVFVEVLKTVLSREAAAPGEDATELLSSIKQHLANLQEVTATVPSAYSKFAGLIPEGKLVPRGPEAIATRILKLYDSALRDRIEAQQQEFNRIRTFEGSVNRFLQDKRLVLGGEDQQAPPSRRGAARVRMNSGREASLTTLSSGERHVLTLLFSATHMVSADGMLLIDEPELSLHVDWQRSILSELSAQAGNRQIVACTHAPEVAADHTEFMVNLDPTGYHPVEQQALSLGGEEVDRKGEQ